MTALIRAVGLLLVTGIFTRFVNETVEAVREPSTSARFQTDGMMLVCVFCSPTKSSVQLPLLPSNFSPLSSATATVLIPPYVTNYFQIRLFALLKVLPFSCPNTSTSMGE